MKKNYFILLIAFGECALITVFFYSFWLSQEVWRVGQEKDNLTASSLTKELAMKGQNAISQKEDLLLIEAIKESSQNNLVRQAFFIDSNGIVLAHTDKEEIGKKQSGFLTDKALIEKRGFTINRLDQGQHLLETAVPLFVGADFKGLARLTFSVENSFQARFLMNIALAIEGVILSLLGISFPLFLKKTSLIKKNAMPASLESPRTGILLLNASNQIIAFSPSLETLLGFSNPMNKHILDVLPQNDFAPLFEKAITTKGQWVLGDLNLKDILVTIEIYAYPVEISQNGAVIFIRESLAAL